MRWAFGWWGSRKRDDDDEYAHRQAAVSETIGRVERTLAHQRQNAEAVARFRARLAALDVDIQRARYRRREKDEP